MFSAFCLIASCGILFYILKFRVHIHVVQSPTRQKPSRKGSTLRKSVRSEGPAKVLPVRDRTSRTVESIPSIRGTGQPNKGKEQSEQAESDIASALRNLGANPAAACRAASRATQQTEDFSQALKLAIQYAQEAA